MSKFRLQYKFLFFWMTDPEVFTDPETIFAYVLKHRIRKFRILEIVG